MASSTLNDESLGFCLADTVVFKVEINVYGGLETASFPSVSTVNGNKHLPTLGRCMKRMLQEEAFSDVTIVVLSESADEDLTDQSPCFSPAHYAPTVVPHHFSALLGGSSAPQRAAPSPLLSSPPQLQLLHQQPPVGIERHLIRAHRVMLSARSPVFRAMLHHDMQERASGTITIDDVDPDVLKEVVTFIYTDECSEPMVMDTMAEALLAAACKYQVGALSFACENYLLEHRKTVDNAVALLRLADTLSLSRMKDHMLNFIAHNAPAVQQTKGYALLMGCNPCNGPVSSPGGHAPGGSGLRVLGGPFVVVSGFAGGSEAGGAGWGPGSSEDLCLKQELEKLLDAVAKRKGCRGSAYAPPGHGAGEGEKHSRHLFGNGCCTM